MSKEQLPNNLKAAAFAEGIGSALNPFYYTSPEDFDDSTNVVIQALQEMRGKHPAIENDFRYLHGELGNPYSYWGRVGKYFVTATHAADNVIGSDAGVDLQLSLFDYGKSSSRTPKSSS